MGYKDKKYKKTLHQQMYDWLHEMLKRGEGKDRHEAKRNGTDRGKIFSYSTYNSYYKYCKVFVKYVNEKHPECTNLRKARGFVNEWLQSTVDNGRRDVKPLSSWTISLERQSVCKLFGIKPDDPDFFQAPPRNRADIIRSRGDAVRDKHFSEKNNEKLVNFLKGTGCRRNVLEKLEGRDLTKRSDLDKEIASLESMRNRTAAESKHLNTLREARDTFPEQEYFLHHRRDKGGKERYAPIIGIHADEIVERMRATAPNERVFEHVSKNADVHGYRSEYATTLYRIHARPIKSIPYDRINRGTGKMYQGDVYTCRYDQAKYKLDRAALLKVSKALGHNRLDVATVYIRGL